MLALPRALQHLPLPFLLFRPLPDLIESPTLDLCCSFVISLRKDEEGLASTCAVRTDVRILKRGCDEEVVVLGLTDLKTILREPDAVDSQDLCQNVV